jgi:hypothetical protein
MLIVTLHIDILSAIIPNVIVQSVVALYEATRKSYKSF